MVLEPDVTHSLLRGALKILGKCREGEGSGEEATGDPWGDSRGRRVLTTTAFFTLVSARHQAPTEISRRRGSFDMTYVVFRSWYMHGMYSLIMKPALVDPY